MEPSRLMEPSSATTLQKQGNHRCKKCNKIFKGKEGLLEHLTKTKKTNGCKDKYNSEEIANLSEGTPSKQQKLDLDEQELDITKCKACGEPFQSLLGHLKRSKKG